MLSHEVLVGLVFFLSLIFTYTNGFQDGSSVAASAIACRALSRLQAVLLVAGCEFLGAMLGGSAVANTIHSITNYPSRIDLLPVLISGLFSAIAWNFVTKKLKFPSSSTHALVGGILGAIVAAGGDGRYIVWGSPDHIMHATGLWKVILSLFVSPAVGFLAGYLGLLVMLILLSRSTTRVNKQLKSLQWLTLGSLAFGHGANDTQKAMGVMMLCLAAVGWNVPGDIPIWVRLPTGLAMAIGVASLVPGIVKKVGMGIYKLRPLHGFVTSASSSIVVLVGSATGGPVSASQVIASTVMGVGTACRRKGVHWLVAKDMLIAWFLTIPCSAIFAYTVHFLSWKCLLHGYCP